MRIYVLVNGPAEKTNGVRVRKLFQDLVPKHEVTFLYRDDSRKWKSTRQFYTAIRNAAPEIIYVEGIGYAGILAALAGKLFHGSRIVLSTGDAAYAFAKSCMNMFKAQLVGAMEFMALRLADAIVVWGPNHKELLEHQGFRNVFWIPGGVDTSRFRPLEVSHLRAEWGLGDALTIGVVGSINLNRKYQFCYGWEVVEVLRLVKGLPVVGVIVGVGSGVPFLKQKMMEYGVDGRLIFVGWVDHDVLPQYINLMDVCISTQSNDLVGQVRITAKVPEYLACGRYIIASDVGGARTFVKDSGLLLPYEGVKDHRYVEAIASHVKEICQDRSVLQSGHKGIDTAKRYFDYSVLRPELRKVLEFVQSTG
jgi:glycosyltransferase involved in cell wall biosynthesis